MAKVKSLPGQRLTVRIEGVMHTAILAGGRVVFKKWPRKRGKTKPGKAKDIRDAFAWACAASTTAIAEDRIAAEMITKSTMYYPRDALISAMYGTLIEVRLKNGTVYTSAREMATNAQVILDQISTIPGTLPVRGATDWIGIPPGTVGYVLTANGPGLIPTWELPQGGGGSGATIAAPPLIGRTTSTSPFCAKGSIWDIQRDFQIVEVICACDYHSGETYKAFVAELDGSGDGSHVTAIHIGPEVLFTETTSYAQYQMLPLDEPVQLSAGKHYCVGSIRTNVSGTTSNAISSSSGSFCGPPLPIYMRFYGHFDHQAIAVGDAISAGNGNNNAYYVGGRVIL